MGFYFLAQAAYLLGVSKPLPAELSTMPIMAITYLLGKRVSNGKRQ